MMVRDFQSVVGIEAREQFLDMTGELPDAVVACVGGGSNAMGLFSGFLNDPVDIYGVEPLGRVKCDVVNHDETIDAFYTLSRLEGIIPAIESSHAVAYGMKLAKTMVKGSVLINLSGRGDKDMDYIIEKFGIR